MPKAGRWEEALNTDSKHYAGKGLGNLGGVDSEKISSHGREHSLEVRLPGLSLAIFRLADHPLPRPSLKQAKK